MNYRIVKLTFEDGIKYFYIQNRFLWLFWKYCKKMTGYDSWDYVKFGSIDDAKRYIEFKEKYKSSNKITKKEIIKI